MSSAIRFYGEDFRGDSEPKRSESLSKLNIHATSRIRIKGAKPFLHGFFIVEKHKKEEHHRYCDGVYPFWCT